MLIFDIKKNDIIIQDDIAHDNITGINIHDNNLYISNHEYIISYNLDTKYKNIKINFDCGIGKFVIHNKYYYKYIDGCFIYTYDNKKESRFCKLDGVNEDFYIYNDCFYKT